MESPRGVRQKHKGQVQKGGHGSLYWADQVARRVIKERGDKKKYTLAAGITPSGTIHIGHFREVITVDLVKRALESKGKKVRFLYSWDDFDRLRKVPGNLPKKTMLKEHLGYPVSDVPDPFDCHKTYAKHFEKEFEESVPPLGMKIDFLYQHDKYKKNTYAENIKKILKNRHKIKLILDKYRKEPLKESYWPVFIFCSKCKTDFTKVLDWDGGYILTYHCNTCKQDHETNFKKDKPGIVSLPWRVDWPMRWAFEGVDFEPGGKEHSTPGGSRTTASIIVKDVFGAEPPVYQMYDYVIVKGVGGKMSSSLGNVILAADMLKVYPPEVLRYIFAGTKPAREFSISMDDEAFKVLEDFYKCERIYYGTESVNKREKAHWSRVYEMSIIAKPTKSMPVQPNYRHCLELINIHQTPEAALEAVREKEKISKNYDLERYKVLLKNARNWLDLTKDERYIFKVNTKAPKVKLTKEQKAGISDLTLILAEKLDEGKLANKMRAVIVANDIPARDFYQLVYKILIGKNAGPRLAPFILAIGQEKVRKLLNATIK